MYIYVQVCDTVIYVCSFVNIHLTFNVNFMNNIIHFSVLKVKTTNIDLVFLSYAESK